MPNGGCPVSFPASVFEQSREAYLVLSDRLECTYANPVAQQLLGTPEQARLRLQAPEWVKFFSPLLNGTPKVPYIQGRVAHDGVRYDVTVWTQSGGLLARLTPEHACAGIPGLSPAHFEEALERAGLGVMLALSNGQIVGVNAAFAAYLATTPDLLAGRDLRSITHPEDALVCLEYVQLAEHRCPVILEKRYVRTGGEPVWMRMLISTFGPPGAGPQPVLCLGYPITDQKKAEQALRRSEWRFRSAVENIEDLLTILDAKGTITYTSPAVERLLGHPVQTRVGAHGFDLLHEEDAPNAQRLWESCIAQYGSVVRMEARLRHRDGSWRWFDLYARNMLHNPALAGVLVTGSDVSEGVLMREQLRKYAAELEQRSLEQLSNTVPRSRKQYLHAVAGELRTSVSGIQAFVELLLSTRLDAQQSECAERIRDSARRLIRVLECTIGLDSEETAEAETT